MSFGQSFKISSINNELQNLISTLKHGNATPLNVNNGTLVLDPVNRRIGINKITPNYTLDVSGSAKFNTIIDVSNSAGSNGQVLVSTGNGLAWSGGTSSSQIDISNSNTNQNFYLTFVPDISGKNSMFVDNNALTFNPNLNRLGIGVSSPSYNLDICGNTYMSGQIIASNGAGVNGQVLSLNAMGKMEWKDVSGSGGGTATSIEVNNVTNDQNYYLTFVRDTSGANNLYIDSNSFVINPGTNRIGLNNLTPSYNIDVSTSDLSAMRIGRALFVDASNNIVTVSGRLQSTVLLDSANSSGNTNLYLRSTPSGLLWSSLGVTSSQWTSDTSGNIYFPASLTDLSNVGIGVIAPTYKLDVSGETRIRTTNVRIGRNAGDISQQSNSIAIGSSAAQDNQRINSIAIGREAGFCNQGTQTIAIGYRAGFCNQGNDASFNSIAIGSEAGYVDQSNNSIAIGQRSGYCNQNRNNVAVGFESAYSTQGCNSVAIGFRSAYSKQGNGCVAIGNQAGAYHTTAQNFQISIGEFAGATNQGQGAIAIGLRTGGTDQGQQAIAIGYNTAQFTQKFGAISIGKQAGYSNQGTQAIAIGVNSGFTNQSNNAIAIGSDSGFCNQGTGSIAIGTSAGYTGQDVSAIAIGYFAGYTRQSTGAVAIGSSAGGSNQGSEAIAIGLSAGATSQGPRSIAIGNNAGITTQGFQAVAIGSFAGTTSQGPSSVAIGNNAGNITQGFEAVAIGNFAGNNSQQPYAVSIGVQAGALAQSSYSIAIGAFAGQDQSNNAVALGVASGQNAQSSGAISIGSSAGQYTQGQNAVAIGTNAGNILQGERSIAIGYQAGNISQAAYSIILNASGTDLSLNTSNSGLYVAPIRNTSAISYPLVYDISSKEIAYNNTTTLETFSVPINTVTANTDVSLGSSYYFPFPTSGAGAAGPLDTISAMSSSTSYSPLQYSFVAPTDCVLRGGYGYFQVGSSDSGSPSDISATFSIARISSDVSLSTFSPTLITDVSTGDFVTAGASTTTSSRATRFIFPSTSSTTINAGDLIFLRGTIAGSGATKVNYPTITGTLLFKKA